MTVPTNTPSDLKSDRQVAESARRFCDLVERSMSFLQSQFELLDDVYAQLPTGSHTTAANDDSHKEWLAEKAVWERHQAVEEARIEEQLDHLTAAWAELETEQRRLMTLGHATQGQMPAPAAEPAVGPVVDSQDDRSAHGSLDLVEPTGQHSSASAAIQFQKLKREICQQSRRRH